MKVIIAGSRNLKDNKAWLTVCKGVNELQALLTESNPITEIVSGKVAGIDTLGEQMARLMHLPIKEMPADWNKYGKSAGPIRNAEMAKYADAAIVVWDGQSPGSRNMIYNMNKLGKKCVIKVVENE